MKPSVPGAATLAALLILLALATLLPRAAQAQAGPQARAQVGAPPQAGMKTGPKATHDAEAMLKPVPGTITLLAFTSEISPAAKMMAPALAATQKEFEGRAAVVVIDVDKHPDALMLHNIRAVPTQVFFDASGREASRHSGFMRQADMRIRLLLLGAR